MSVCTWWALIFGVGCSLLTFLPDDYIVYWVLSSVPFYIYLFCCYLNYLLFYEQVESAMESEMIPPPPPLPGLRKSRTVGQMMHRLIMPE